MSANLRSERIGINRRELDLLKAAPPGYEVSFIAPPGLSGAPLLTLMPDGLPYVCGLIPGHYTAEFQDRRMGFGHRPGC
jgi:hypothetical protein